MMTDNEKLRRKALRQIKSSRVTLRKLADLTNSPLVSGPLYLVGQAHDVLKRYTEADSLSENDAWSDDRGWTLNDLIEQDRRDRLQRDLTNDS